MTLIMGPWVICAHPRTGSCEECDERVRAILADQLRQLEAL